MNFLHHIWSIGIATHFGATCLVTKQFNHSDITSEIASKTLTLCVDKLLTCNTLSDLNSVSIVCDQLKVKKTTTMKPTKPMGR